MKALREVTPTEKEREIAKQIMSIMIQTQISLGKSKDEVLAYMKNPNTKHLISQEVFKLSGTKKA